MKDDDRNGLHLGQYVLVLLAMGLLTFIETRITFLRSDLIGAPFLLILTISALFGDYISVIFATIIGVIGIGLISVHGGHFDSVTIRRSIEFLVAGVIIFVLSSRSRRLVKSHLSLEETIEQLEQATRKLDSEVKLKRKDMVKLTRLNQDLREVIDNVMEDKALWETNVKTSVNQKENQIKKL